MFYISPSSGLEVNLIINERSELISPSLRSLISILDSVDNTLSKISETTLYSIKQILAPRDRVCDLDENFGALKSENHACAVVVQCLALWW